MSDELVVEALHATHARAPLSLDETPPDGTREHRTRADHLAGEEPGYRGAEHRAHLDALAARLTPDQRTVLRLHFQHDLTQREIGQRLGVSEMHVWRLLKGALEQMRSAERAAERHAHHLHRASAGLTRSGSGAARPQSSYSRRGRPTRRPWADDTDTCRREHRRRDPRHDIEETQQASTRAGLVTLLVVQIIIGYEWLALGAVEGRQRRLRVGACREPQRQRRLGARLLPGLPQSLRDSQRADLRRADRGRRISSSVLGLIVVAIVWLAGWQRLSDRSRASILVVMMAAALVALWMSINFHLAGGGNQPWLIPGDGFDEALDIDTVLAFIEAAYLAFSGYVLLVLRRAHRAGAVSSRAGRGVLAPEA